MGLRKHLVWMALLALIGCNDTGGSGGIQLTVYHSRRPAALKDDAALPDVLHVQSFRVTISGPDINPPIEVTFPGDASRGDISGIPVGEDRTVRIEALNSSGQVIRQREVKGISISGGDPTPIQATLVSVPWITNIPNNGIVPITRLAFQGYGEPGAGIEVIDHFNNVTSTLSDISTATTLVSPSLSDGGFSFRPPALTPGVHTFEFHDPQTGANSQITVTLVSSNRIPGTFLSYGGQLTLKSTSGLGLNQGAVINAASH